MPLAIWNNAVAQSDFDRRYAAAQAEMAKAGVKPGSANPPLLWLAALLGLRIRPVPYQGVLASILSFGLFFALVWSGIMYLWVWRGQAMPVLLVVNLAVLAGLIFGSLMTALTRFQNRGKPLSRWQDL